MSHGSIDDYAATVARRTHEQLESRRLLSAVPQSVLDAGFEPIEWRGETVYAKPGQWLLQLKGVAGDAGRAVGEGERATRQAQCRDQSDASTSAATACSWWTHRESSGTGS